MGRKHTEENRFRFQSFGDRITAIRIGANAKVKRFDTIPDDAETFLGENLQKWATTNCSSEYSAFECQLTPLCGSLPLVYLHRQKIAALFQKYLASATKLSQETLLDLLVHFARDLSSEFVPFAHDFVRLLVEISLKNTKDPDVLEWSFSCLAHLMKLLWKFFVEHIESFLEIVMPTFEGNLPAYIRQFSAEAFAFLVRKSSDLLGTVRLIVEKQLTANPSCSYGLALVIFEVVNGANKTFLPCTEEVAKLLVELCRRQEEAESSQAELFQIFLNSCAEHVSVQNCGLIFKILLAHLQSTASAQSCKEVALSQFFFTTWLAYRQGMLCCDANVIAKAVVDAMAWHHDHDSCCDHLLSIFSTVIRLKNNSLPNMQCYVHVKTLFDLSVSKAKLFDFALEHVSSPLFSSSFLPHVLNILLKFEESSETKSANTSIDENSYDFCDEIMSEQNVAKGQEAEEVDFVQESLLAILAKLALESSSTNIKVTNNSLPDSVVKQFAKLIDSNIANLPHVWSVAVISHHFKLIDNNKRDCANLLAESFGKFCSFVKTKLNSSDTDNKSVWQLLMLYEKVASCFNSLGKASFEQRTLLSNQEAVSLLVKFPNNLSSLRLAKTVIDTCVDDEFQKNLEESEKLYSALAEQLEGNLASPSPEIREVSLHILERASRAIYQAHSASLATASMKPGVNVLLTLLNAENTAADLQNFKSRLNLLQKIRADIIGNQPSLINWQRLCVFFLTGQLAINFTPLHKPIGQLLVSYVENIARDKFWAVFAKLLSEIYQKTTEINSDHVGDEDEEEEVTFELAKSCSQLLQVTACDLAKKCRYSTWHVFHVRIWEVIRLFRVEDLETSSRHYVPIFLEFIASSFTNVVSSSTLPLVNLVVAPGSEKRLRQQQTGGSFGERRHCLETMLNVFSKLRHRSQLVSADKIVAAVFRLLKLPRPELQKPALEFLLNTNWPAIGVYKELLTNLLEPKKYRGSLVEFGDLSTLPENDRKNVLPVLLRLIFGQMHFSKNKKRSGKTGYAKKSASLAFLANISSSEIGGFVDIALEPFQSSTKWFQNAFRLDETSDFATVDDIDPMAFPSTELQFWFFHTFMDAVSNLHNVTSEQWRPFFRIAVTLYAMTTNVLIKNNNVLDSQHEKRLKRLRKLAFKSFSTFFARCSNAFVDWTSDGGNAVEIESFFNHVVWPELDRSLTGGSELLPLLSLASVFATDSLLRSPLLLREKPVDPSKTLLSSIFDSMKTAKILSSESQAIDLKIVDSYMQFFEHLLPSEEITDDDDESDRQFTTRVFAHRNVVIALVSNILALSKKNKLCRNRVPKALTVFRRVTAHVDDPHCAAEVFQLLLSMLSNNSLPLGESQTTALQSILDVVPSLVAVSESQLSQIAQCFSRANSRQSRMLLCTVLERISDRLAPYCDKISKIVHNLNAWSRKDLEEPDFELRLAAFSECIRLLQQPDDTTLTTLDVTFLLNNCLFFLLNVDDFSIRANSSELITVIIQWAEKRDDSQKTIVNAVVSACCHGIQHKSEIVRHEFLRVLAQLVRLFPNHSALVGLAQLTDNNDADADFFENMRHVQHHRRARALRRLASLLQQQKNTTEQEIGLRPLTSFILPLAQMYLMSAASSGSGSKMPKSVVDASLDLLRACCLHLPWPTYQRLLSRFQSQLISGNVDKVAFNIRAVVAILDSYHFVSFANAVETESDRVEPVKAVEPKQKDERPDSDNSVLRAIQGQIVPNMIEAINAQLLPGSLASSQCAVVPLTITAVRLLVHSPPAYRIATIPSFILKLVEFLKSRFLEVRTAARKSLGQICLALGPSQFGAIVRDLRISLTRGYQRHVLTYTVGELVRTVQPSFKPGQLDSCVKELTSIFCQELFSVLSEEKEAECKVAGKWPEARRRASLHAYPVLANLVSRTSMDAYLHPLQEVLMTTTDAEKVRRARQVLQLIIPILAQNPGIALSDLVTLARRWLQCNQTKEETTKSTPVVNTTGLLEPRPQPSQLLPPKPARMGLAVPVINVATNNHVISEFGLRLLFSLIKHNRLTDSTVFSAFLDDEVQLAAFSNEVHSLMKLGGNEAVLYAALQLATVLLSFKIPAFTDRLGSLADSVFELLKSELLQKNTQSRLLVACFKAAGVLVELARSDLVANRQNRVGLDSEQIDALLICIDEALLGDRQGVCALQLLKKLLDSALKSLQLTEIINGTITKTALRGRDDHQPLARACILSYMLHYPVGQKSLQSMLDTFVGILTIENSEACVVRASLEMLFLIATHFPEKELDRCCVAVFLPVAALFVNSRDSEVRELVNVVLVRLLSRVSQLRRDGIFKEMVLPWLGSGKMLRQQLAGQVIAAFAEAENDQFEARLANVMPTLVNLIEENASSKITEEGEEDKDDNENKQSSEVNNEAPVDDSLDGVIYSLLCCTVKLIRQFHLTAITACSRGFPQLILVARTFSLHPHGWIRCQIGYLWYELFQTVDSAEFLQAAGLASSSEDQLKKLCRRIINQLLTQGISSEFGEKVALNCVFLSRILLKMANSDLITWFCRRVVRIAMAESIYEAKMSCVKRLCVFKWMAAFTADFAMTKLDKGDVVSVLVVPLVRELKESSTLSSSHAVTNEEEEKDGENKKGGDDDGDDDDMTTESAAREDPIARELKPVCLELTDLFRKTFGVKLFSSAWNVAVKKAAERKLKRNAERAGLAITDPARAARLKVYKQTSKREARKRRIAHDKIGRGATGSRKKSKRFDAEAE